MELEEHKQINKGMLLGVAGVILFSLTLPVTRLIVPYFDPIFIGLGRSVIAAIPAVIAYNRFAAKVDRLSVRYESFMEEFTNILQRRV